LLKYWLRKEGVTRLSIMVFTGKVKGLSNFWCFFGFIRQNYRKNLFYKRSEFIVFWL